MSTFMDEASSQNHNKKKLSFKNVNIMTKFSKLIKATRKKFKKEVESINFSNNW